MDLIQRTKAAVRELDNLNYRKMKKILMVDSQENEMSTTEPEEDSTVSIQKKTELLFFKISEVLHKKKIILMLLNL